MRIAFCGLGTMGAPMAGRLLDAGHEVSVWNRTPARATSLEARGAKLAATPAAGARGAELCITMLADEAALEEVLGALLPGLEPGVLLVDLSTVGRAAALAAHARVTAQGSAFVDAPVSGSRGAARAGTLIVLCGGAAHDVERARPALSCFGRVEHVGPAGSGAATKLVINALGAQELVALTNALGLAERMGLDRARTLELVLAGPFTTPSFVAKRERLLAADPGRDPEFTLALWEKDQRLVLEEAERHGYAMRPLEAGRALMQEAIADGRGEEDMTALLHLFTR